MDEKGAHASEKHFVLFNVAQKHETFGILISSRKRGFPFRKFCMITHVMRHSRPRRWSQRKLGLHKHAGAWLQPAWIGAPPVVCIPPNTVQVLPHGQVTFPALQARLLFPDPSARHCTHTDCAQCAKSTPVPLRSLSIPGPPRRSGLDPCSTPHVRPGTQVFSASRPDAKCGSCLRFSGGGGGWDQPCPLHCRFFIPRGCSCYPVSCGCSWICFSGYPPNTVCASMQAAVHRLLANTPWGVARTAQPVLFIAQCLPQSLRDSVQDIMQWLQRETNRHGSW